MKYFQIINISLYSFKDKKLKITFGCKGCRECGGATDWLSKIMTCDVTMEPPWGLQGLSYSRGYLFTNKPSLLLSYLSFSPTSPSLLPLLLSYTSPSPIPLLLLYLSFSSIFPSLLPLLLIYLSFSPTSPSHLSFCLYLHLLDTRENFA